MATISEQFHDVFVRTMDEANAFMDAQNLISLIPERNRIKVDDRLVMKVIQRYLKDVGRAHLSRKGWDPRRVTAEMGLISHWRYSAGIEYPLDWEDFEVLVALEGDIYQMGLDKVFEQPAITASCYLMTGKELLDDNTYGDPPVATQYNFVMDPGTGDGTLSRPLIAYDAAGGNWAITASEAGVIAMIGAIDNLIDGVTGLGFNKDSCVILYPEIGQGSMGKRKSTGGDGFYDAFKAIVDKGIPLDRIIKVKDLYIPRNDDHAAPVATEFDIYIIDLNELFVIEPEELKANIYPINEKSMHPSIMAEANYQFVPFFRPNYRKVDGKCYKGVGRLTAIDGTSTS